MPHVYRIIAVALAAIYACNANASEKDVDYGPTAVVLKTLLQEESDLDELLTVSLQTIETYAQNGIYLTQADVDKNKHQGRALDESDEGNIVSAGRGVIDLQNLLHLDPSQDGKLSLDELETLVRGVIAKIDTNRDHRASHEEIADADSWLGIEERKFEAKRINAKRAMPCDLHDADSAENIVVISMYEGGLYLPPSRKDAQKIPQRTSVIRVEEGPQPLHLILSNASSVIWKFEGAVQRVGHVSLLSNNDSAVSVTNIDPAKVAQLPDQQCFRPFNAVGPSIEGARAKAAVYGVFKRWPLVTFGAYKIGELSIPSGKAVDATGRIFKKDMKTDTNHPLMKVSDEVVHLMAQGKIEQLNQFDYKIVRPIPKWEKRLENVQRLLLGKGLPIPQGDIGEPCLISEETGEILLTGLGPCL